jgi:putative membrane protein
MRQILSEADRNLLNEQIAETEMRTNAQIVLATIKRSDNYTEIPWKAFSLGISLMGFTVFLVDLFLLNWITGGIILFSVVSILATGILSVLLTILFPGFARLFLSESRKEAETMQYAESLFLGHELFATDGRRGVLLLVSLFERKVIILADKGVRDRLKPESITTVISSMKEQLRKSAVRNALETGLEELCKILSPPISGGSGKDELSNEIIEEEGE